MEEKQGKHKRWGKGVYLVPRRPITRQQAAPPLASTSPAAGVYPATRRPVTRRQTKTPAALSPASTPSADESTSSIVFVSRKCASKSKPTANISLKKMKNSDNEWIPSSEDTSSHQQSKQHSTSERISSDYHNWLLEQSRDQNVHDTVADKEANAATGYTFSSNNSSSEQMLSLAENVSHSLPDKEVNVATDDDAFAPNASSSKQVATEVTRAETNLVEEPTRDPGKLVAVEEVRGETNVVEDLARDRCDNSREMDENLSQSCGRGLTEFVNMFADDASSEEVGSSSGTVSVRGYVVKKEAAQMLESILGKHGDIAINCTATTVAGRSVFLEKICDIMQTLQATKFVDMNEFELKKLKDIVEDCGKINLQVGWLLERLEVILETKKAIKDYPELKEAEAAYSKSMQELKVAMHCYDFVIEEEEKKIQESKSAIQEFKKKKDLEQEKMKKEQEKAKSLKKKFSAARDRSEFFMGNSLIQDLV